MCTYLIEWSHGLYTCKQTPHHESMLKQIEDVDDCRSRDYMVYVDLI